MPFVVFADVENLLPPAVRSVLRDADKFSAVENEAAITIRDIANIDIPNDVDDAPDWVRMPMAQLMSYYGLSLVNANRDGELADLCKRNYDAAIATAKRNRVARKSPSGTSGRTGQLLGQWNGR